MNFGGNIMGKGGRFNKYGEIKESERLKVKPGPGQKISGRDRIKFDEHRKIAPGHPNNGRR